MQAIMARAVGVVDMTPLEVTTVRRNIVVLTKETKIIEEIEGPSRIQTLTSKLL